jgi:hypothetical protein
VFVRVAAGSLSQPTGYQSDGFLLTNASSEAIRDVPAPDSPATVIQRKAGIAKLSMRGFQTAANTSFRTSNAYQDSLQTPV